MLCSHTSCVKTLVAFGCPRTSTVVMPAMFVSKKGGKGGETKANSSIRNKNAEYMARDQFDSLLCTGRPNIKKPMFSVLTLAHTSRSWRASKVCGAGERESRDEARAPQNKLRREKTIERCILKIKISDCATQSRPQGMRNVWHAGRY